MYLESLRPIINESQLGFSSMLRSKINHVASMLENQPQSHVLRLPLKNRSFEAKALVQFFPLPLLALRLRRAMNAFRAFVAR